MAETARKKFRSQRNKTVNRMRKLNESLQIICVLRFPIDLAVRRVGWKRSMRARSTIDQLYISHSSVLRLRRHGISVRIAAPILWIDIFANVFFVCSLSSSVAFVGGCCSHCGHSFGWIGCFQRRERKNGAAHRLTRQFDGIPSAAAHHIFNGMIALGLDLLFMWLPSQPPLLPPRRLQPFV